MSQDNNQENKMLVTYNIGETEIKLTPNIVQQYIATGGQTITLPEFKMFSELCKVRKLNPFLKEAYIIKFGSEPATIVVGKDAILKRAVKHPAFNGREQGIMVLSKDGTEIIERKGAFYLQGEKVVGGWAKVFRKDWEHPVYVTVSMVEGVQTKRDGTPNKNWQTKPATMIEKVALVRALREAFVEELQGMFDETETLDVEKRENVEAIDSQIDTFHDEVKVGKEDHVIEIDLDEV